MIKDKDIDELLDYASSDKREYGRICEMKIGLYESRDYLSDNLSFELEASMEESLLFYRCDKNSNVVGTNNKQK